MGAQNSKQLVGEQYDEKNYEEAFVAADMDFTKRRSLAAQSNNLARSLAALNIHDGQDRKIYSHLTSVNLDEFSKEFRKEDKNLLALSVVNGADPTQVLINQQAALQDNHVFNVKLDLEGKITNQKSSGRCWIFAGTNVLRLAVIQKYNLSDDFELSQSYLFFYDKLEKANWFLENMIDTAHDDVNDRVVQYLLQSPVGDGGQWDMFVNVVEKYGVVPKSAFPETYSSSNSRRLNWLVTVKLREFAAQIRQAAAEGVSVTSIRALKDVMMKDIYRIMAICLAEPPTKFDWECTDKSGKYIGVKGLTPLQFFKDIVEYPIAETLSLINDPRNPVNCLYTVSRLGNVIHGRPIRYVNTEAFTLKKLAINTLKANTPVWFGCDVGQFSSNKYGAMDTDIYTYNLAFNVGFNMTKEQRLLYGESMMTHAMVFTGVHLDDKGLPVRWRVENSWGPDSGDKGYWVMSDAWFTEFVYQVVLEKKNVPRKLVSLLDTEPTILPAYDPMGALA